MKTKVSAPLGSTTTSLPERWNGCDCAPLSCKTCIHVPGVCEPGQKEEWKQEDSSMVKRLHCELAREEWRYCVSGVFTSFWLTSCHQWPHWTKQKQNTHCSHSKLLSHNAQGHRVGGHGTIFKQWDHRDTDHRDTTLAVSNILTEAKGCSGACWSAEAGCRCLLVATVLLIVKWKTHSQQSHGYMRLNSLNIFYSFTWTDARWTHY